VQEALIDSPQTSTRRLSDRLNLSQTPCVLRNTTGGWN
jgi:hypothetical protein